MDPTNEGMHFTVSKFSVHLSQRTQMLELYLLGEQLLTEVKALLKTRLRCASWLRWGVRQTLLLYTWVSKPASSPEHRITIYQFFRVNVCVGVLVPVSQLCAQHTLKSLHMLKIQCPPFDN